MMQRLDTLKKQVNELIKTSFILDISSAYKLVEDYYLEKFKNYEKDDVFTPNIVEWKTEDIGQEYLDSIKLLYIALERNKPLTAEEAGYIPGAVY